MALPSFSNIVTLCRKEWRSLFHDAILMFFIVFAFSFSIYSQAKGTSTELKKAAVGIVDEDRSALSLRFRDALREPYFGRIETVPLDRVEQDMESAQYTFVLIFPQKMEADLRAGKNVTLQLLIDATVMSQSQIGAGYIQNIIQLELARYFKIPTNEVQPVNLIIRYAFNQSREPSWFSSVTGVIQNITMLAILLTGAALIRERERGTIEHLLVMPVTALEIVLSKVIANGIVILAAAFLSLQFVVRGMIGVDIQGSIGLFMLASALYLFFTTGLGLFLGTISRSMPQMGLLFILTIMPMNMLSGGVTPLESMPVFLQHIMRFMPTTEYISLAQAILFRNADFSIVWPKMLSITVTGLVFFIYSAKRFRSFLERQG